MDYLSSDILSPRCITENLVTLTLRGSVAAALFFTPACSEATPDNDEPNGSQAGGSAAGKEVEPLNTGCEDEVCHVSLRLNANTLEVLGYAVQGSKTAATTPADVGEVAQTFMDDNLPYPTVPMIGGPAGGVYTASVEPGDFGGFVLVGEESGLTIAAGSITFAGSGGYWTPTDWLAASDVELGSQVVAPGGSQGEGGSCAGVARSDDALEVALSSNLAVHLAEQGNFSTYSYLYTPDVGVLSDDGCEAGAAEYLIVMTQVK